ncbi:small nuclear ribonucleoprotein E [Caerostris extrusa]|uniref:Small nuclear ribonucleoprotein E n=1 Tax=Caerostris extrusa TaxID=172846 RepID=A0AAV4XAY2_CAEEX|nr:small nuclear ribonucleoprotein E [Caerostris extrusa]
MAYITQKVRKYNLQPINVIFRYLLNKSRIQVWLYDVNFRIEGTLLGFDEHFNLVLYDAEKVLKKSKARMMLGRILLKAERILLIRNIDGTSVA